MTTSRIINLNEAQIPQIFDVQKDYAPIPQENGILIDFYADWCGPCKGMMPIIERFSEQNPNLLIYKLDIDQHPHIATKLNIRSIPTFLFIKTDGDIKRHVGSMSVIQLEQFCQ